MSMEYSDIRNAIIGEGTAIPGPFGQRALLYADCVVEGAGYDDTLPNFAQCLEIARNLAAKKQAMTAPEPIGLLPDEDALRWFRLSNEAWAACAETGDSSPPMEGAV